MVVKRTPSKVLPFIALALVHDATATRLGMMAPRQASQTQQPVEMEALLVSLAAQQQASAAPAQEQQPAASAAAAPTVGLAKERAAAAAAAAAAPARRASSFLPVLPKPRFLAADDHAASTACRYVSVSTTFTVHVSTSGTHVLSGTTVAASSAPHAIGLSRADVRMCSDGAQGHARVEAACEAWEIPAGGRVACAWHIELPGESEAGSSLEHWTGVASSVTVELDGACCHAPALHPLTGQPGGTCAARRG